MTGLWVACVAVYLGAGCALLLQGALQLALLSAIRRPSAPPPAPPASVKGSLLVQLPVFNEAPVVERLLDAAAGLKWEHGPLHIQILDDSTDDTPSRIQDWLAEHSRNHRATWSHERRANRSGFKAGALAAGMERVPSADFVAIFDADFVPAPAFLHRAVQALAEDPNTAAVQARWAHLNADENALTAIQRMNLDAHFTVEQGGRSALGQWAAFNGTAGVWRSEAIHSAGGWRSDTLAEDFDLSIRAQMAGWGIRYLDGVEAPAELPTDFWAYASQQHRWTAGGAGCARKHVLAVLRATRGQRRRHALGQLFSSSIHLPVWLMTTASVPLVGVEHCAASFRWVLPVGSVFALALGVLVLVYAETHRRRGMAPGWGRRMAGMLLLGSGMTWRNMRSVLRGWAGTPGEFVRTPKGGTRARPDRVGWPVEALWALYFLGGLGLGVWAGEWGLVPFHALLAAGYGWVAWLSWAR